MFGYVIINKPELKVKEFYQYKAYYCGLCRILKKKYGPIGQLTLSYDMTFLILLLTSLHECDTKQRKSRCIVHPVRKQIILQNEITEYVADMNIALTYHHLRDDWQDERSMVGLTGAEALKRAYKKIYRKYERQCKGIEEALIKLSECEKNKETDPDLVSRCFGELMSELFAYRQDMWEEKLRKIGFYLGKFIYLLDAYDDIEKDRKKGCYNPLIRKSTEKNFEVDCRNMLVRMMTDCSSEFEKLPCLSDVTILRNILYEGVWIRFNKIQEDRRKKEGK